MQSSSFNAADGDGYELAMGRWSRRLAELFIDFAGAADGEEVLDVGCGTGSLAFTLAKRSKVKSIKGIDFAPPYVAYAAARNSDPRIAFETGDACAMPFADRSFDRVLSLLVLHFVPDANKAVAEMKRVARPGATVAATVWDARGGYVANRIFYDTAAALDPAAVARRAQNLTRPMTRPGELAAAWRAAGLTDVRDALLTIRMDFENFADFWAPLSGKDGPQAAYVNSLAPDQAGKIPGRAQRGLLRRRSRRPALLCRERLGGARHRAIATMLQPRRVVRYLPRQRTIQ